ncbi:porin family protein [Dyadobacter aurulentus]|uniref:porin family protein n=1 Tax=Dyadobacter sp. UC 10 TaxID=2605428 RepID=UPI0011F318C6|nr:porin family protein [Dyadobacter sp. UC 10]KAA0989474.1 porin family protein [Dyadobacter sp. UC 10]
MTKALILLIMTLALPVLQSYAQNTVGAEWKKDRIEDTLKVKEKEAEKHYIPTWQFGLNGGLAKRLFRSGIIASSAEEKYMDDLKSGISFGANASYFLWRQVGFGLVYDRYQSKASAADGLSENVLIQHLSGSVIHRAVLKSLKTSVISSFMLGYQPYHNKASVDAEHLNFSANTMGWGLSVGIERRLGNRFALNLTGSAMMGAVYRLKKETAFNTSTLHLSKDDHVDLSRASLTLGLRFF